MFTYKSAVLYAQEHNPTEGEEELQGYLQDFALALLETNPSWSDRAVIQNLVIWEPVGPVIPMKKVCKLVFFSNLFTFQILG